jgi:hypothetical protein
MEHCFDRFVEEGVPIHNGDQWCEFVDARAAARVEQSTDETGNLVYAVSGLTCRLPLMIPVSGDATAWQVTVNGADVTAPVLRRLGRDYLFVPLQGDAQGTAMRVAVRSRACP